MRSNMLCLTCGQKEAIIKIAGCANGPAIFCNLKCLDRWNEIVNKIKLENNVKGEKIRLKNLKKKEQARLKLEKEKD